MNESIIKFLSRQSCASICCMHENGSPYSFICYYAFNPNEGILYFKSSSNAYHIKQLEKNAAVSGTILPDKLNKLQIRGIQFEGRFLPEGESSESNASSCYYQKHPIARAIPGEVRAVQINKIKFTDNTLGFGKKSEWEREESRN